ncbi:hypothetical protein IMX07_08885 [bacterium]|nr:hypothetical protein [bacterium]
MSKVNSSKDLLMLLLYAKGKEGRQAEPVRGRTRLMKMVFLFKQELMPRFKLAQAIDKSALPDFTAYDYGPFSSDVFADLEFLVDLGFVSVKPVSGGVVLPEETLEYEYWQAGADSSSGSGIAGVEEEFSLTEIGSSFVAEGRAGKLTDEQWEALNELKARCTAANLRSLLRYVYEKYPEMTTKSKIRDEILSQG